MKNETTENPSGCDKVDALVRRRFLVVQECLECTVWDSETRKHLFPISDGCGLGTARLIADALNFYEANSELDRFVPPNSATPEIGREEEQ